MGNDELPAAKMHVDEVDIDVGLVRRLLAAQFPAWAELPLAPVLSAGECGRSRHLIKPYPPDQT